MPQRGAKFETVEDKPARLRAGALSAQRFGSAGEIARDLRAYGEYAQGSSASHVVASALRRLFREDKGFKSFREANPSAGSVKIQKIRKSSPTSEKGAA